MRRGERISSLVVAISLMEAWVWANGVHSTMATLPAPCDAAGGSAADGTAPLHDGEALPLGQPATLQLSSLARHYEQSTSIFRGGTCDTLAARQHTLTRAQLALRGDVVTPPALPAAMELRGHSRPSNTPDLPALGRTAHRTERRRRLSAAGKKSTPRGLLQWLAPLAPLLLHALATGKKQQQQQCRQHRANLGWAQLFVAAAALQLPAAAAASQSATSAEGLYDLFAQPPSVLYILACLLPLYLAYSAYVSRTYPPRMHVLWDGLRGKFQLDEYGPVECLRQAQRKHGEIFRICLPGQSCTFLIGREACQHWFKQPNVRSNPAALFPAAS